MPLKKVTIYFTEEEYRALQAIAEDEEVTLSAVLRAKLGLAYKRRGAPRGNANRRARAKTNPQGRTGKSRR
jgi:hypothetical protein